MEWQGQLGIVPNNLLVLGDRRSEHIEARYRILKTYDSPSFLASAENTRLTDKSINANLKIYFIEFMQRHQSTDLYRTTIHEITRMTKDLLRSRWLILLILQASIEYVIAR